jgi:Flp pilus assembly pilin Flp
MRVLKNKGQGVVEYAVLVAVVAGILILVLGYLKSGMSTAVSRAGKQITATSTI